MISRDIRLLCVAPRLCAGLHSAPVRPTRLLANTQVGMPTLFVGAQLGEHLSTRLGGGGYLPFLRDMPAMLYFFLHGFDPPVDEVFVIRN